MCLIHALQLSNDPRSAPTDGSLIVTFSSTPAASNPLRLRRRADYSRAHHCFRLIQFSPAISTWTTKRSCSDLLSMVFSSPYSAHLSSVTSASRPLLNHRKSNQDTQLASDPPLIYHSSRCTDTAAPPQSLQASHLPYARNCLLVTKLHHDHK